MNNFEKIENLKAITTKLIVNKDKKTTEVNRLLCELAPLILSMACKYNSHDVDVNDLYQEGVLGVYDAYLLYGSKKFKLRDKIISQIPKNSDFKTFEKIIKSTIKNSEVILQKVYNDKPQLANTNSQIMWVVENIPYTKFSSFAFFYIRNRIKNFKNKMKYGENRNSYYTMFADEILLTEKVERDKNYEKLFYKIPQQDRRLLESYYGIGCEKRSVNDLAKQNGCCVGTIYNRLNEVKHLIYFNATKFNISISCDL